MPGRYVGSGCRDPHILDLSTSWRSVDSFIPGTHWIEGWLGPRIGLNEEERKSRPYQDSNSEPSAIQPIVSLCTNCIILDP
jgi:hypothetical protein